MMRGVELMPTESWRRRSRAGGDLVIMMAEVQVQMQVQQSSRPSDAEQERRVFEESKLDFFDAWMCWCLDVLVLTCWCLDVLML